MKMPKRLLLEKKLQNQRNDLIINDQDLSLLKLKNPPLYRLRHEQQSKAKSNIRKAISRTKKQLNNMK